MEKLFSVVVLNSSPPWCTCLLTQHPFTQKQSRFSVVFKSKCVRYVLASHYFGCKTSFTGNLLFNLPQKVFACISGPPITLPLFPLGVKSKQDDYVFVFLYVFVFVSVFLFCISIPPYHASTVSTWWNPDKMILILCCCDDSATWFSICDQNSYRWKCLLAFHSTTNQTTRPCLGWKKVIGSRK